MALLTNLRVPVLYRLVRLVAIACYLAIPLLTFLLTEAGRNASEKTYRGGAVLQV